ncbi:Reovirus sigma C capsid domain-containing protein [Rhizoctonia solani AG-1 IA]|uniref:Reovirus sigma C capsid domain-containing protein n=1 Tax=Thanatephorus cucumeris (strain AG1-IA) TaxID=983506 RepID=L8WKL4_THACA|nr:Reovirus sigma C capsid domain-containing protein [Rhizoctonia solani AG-1 IA]
MAAATAPPSQAHLDAALNKFKTEGVSQKESDEFVQGVIDELDNDSGQGKFAENVSQVAQWAAQVDESFSKVTYGLKDMNDKYGTTFPPLRTFLSEWQGYNQRWTTHLALSRDVASEHAAVLQRFDNVFLYMVKSIETDQDRKDVIVELESFANENHGDSQRMAEGFRSLKRDIEGYVVRFDAWVQTTSTELKQQAQDLQKVIEDLQAKIEELDKKVRRACLPTVRFLKPEFRIDHRGYRRIIGQCCCYRNSRRIAGTTLAIALAERIGELGLLCNPFQLGYVIADKTITLSNKRQELAEVNRQQEALAHVKTAFDGLKPDIALICQKLSLFGEIWSSVQAQTRAFQETLRGGMEAVTNFVSGSLQLGDRQVN